MRERKRLVLTAAGREFASQLQPLLDSLERVTLGLRARQSDSRQFNLCTAATFGSRWLLPRLSGLYRRHPEVLLNLSTRVGMPDFAAMRLDAALVYCTEPPAGFGGHKVLPLRLLAVASSRLFKSGRVPSGLSVFERLPLLEQTTLPDAWPGYFRSLGRSPKSTIRGPRFDLLSMGHEVALAGLGVALLPGFLVNGDLHAGRLLRVHAHEWETPGSYWLSYPAHHASLPWLARIRDWLMEEASEGDALAPAARAAEI